MSRVYRLLTIAAVLTLLVVSLTLAMGLLNLGEVNAQSECSLQTLNGSYVFEGKGVLVEGEEAVVVSYAEAGYQTFDGEGNFEGVFSASLNGEVFAAQEYFTGTYRYDGNCTFTNLAPVGGEILEFQLYTTREGNYMSYMGPGVSGTARKP